MISSEVASINLVIIYLADWIVVNSDPQNWIPASAQDSREATGPDCAYICTWLSVGHLTTIYF